MRRSRALSSMAAPRSPMPSLGDGVAPLLAAALDADASIRTAAETALQTALPAPGTPPALLAAATAAGLPHALRQLAAVLLKRGIARHWSVEGDGFCEPQVRRKRGEARAMRMARPGRHHRSSF